MPGVVRVMDPKPYDYSFGTTEEEIVRNNLTYLEEVIQYEGPKNIAAMFIETVTGTNGILPPPKGYLKGLKALLEKHGILLVTDEVMCGWGRTGKLFAFQHGDIVPDICTMAKGLTSSYLPLGVMAVSDRIANHFRENVFWGGLTYNAHPLCLASALAAVNALVEEGMVENAARMGQVMRGHMERLAKKHRCIKEHRNIGLFGTIELRKNSEGRASGALRRHAPRDAEGGQVPEGQRSVHRAAVEHAHVQSAAVHQRGADGRRLRHHRPRARPGGRGVRGLRRA